MKQLPSAKQELLNTIYTRLMSGEQLNTKSTAGLPAVLAAFKKRKIKFSRSEKGMGVSMIYFMSPVDVQINAEKNLSKLY